MNRFFLLCFLGLACSVAAPASGCGDLVLAVSGDVRAKVDLRTLRSLKRLDVRVLADIARSNPDSLPPEVALASEFLTRLYGEYSKASPNQRAFTLKGRAAVSLWTRKHLPLVRAAAPNTRTLNLLLFRGDQRARDRYLSGLCLDILFLSGAGVASIRCLHGGWKLAGVATSLVVSLAAFYKLVADSWATLEYDMRANSPLVRRFGPNRQFSDLATLADKVPTEFPIALPEGSNGRIPALAIGTSGSPDLDSSEPAWSYVLENAYDDSAVRLHVFLRHPAFNLR